MSKAKVLRALRFLRITDAENNLSLTNLALLAAIVNLSMRDDVRLEDMLTFAATVAGYQVRRFFTGAQAPAGSDADDIKSAVAALESRVAALQVGKVLTKTGQK